MKLVLCWSLVGLGLLLSLQSYEARRKPHARVVEEDQTIGGTPAKFGEFPFMVRLTVWDYTHWFTIPISCSGTVIDKWHVLTSIMCIRERPWDENNHTLVDPGQIYMKYHCTHLHKYCEEWYGFVKLWAYKNGSYPAGSKNDIVLLRTQEEIEIKYSRERLDQLVFPLFWDCAKENANCSDLGHTKYMTLVSWGKSDPKTDNPHMTKTDLVVNDDRYCRKHPAYNKDVMFCAGGRGRMPCGDLGSPIVRKLSGEDEWFQEGIVSMESKECNETYGAIFTRLRAYQKWIKGCLDESFWGEKQPGGRIANKYCTAEYIHNASTFKIPRYQKKSHPIHGKPPIGSLSR